MIAVKLVSGVKSEVEGLRWFLTRSAALALLGTVVAALLVLRVGSNRKSKEKLQMQQEKDMKSTVPSREMGTQTSSKYNGNSSNGDGRSSVSTSTGTDIGEEALYKSVEQGGDPGYVTLG